MLQPFTAGRRRLLGLMTLLLPVSASRATVVGEPDTRPVVQPDNPGVKAFIRRAFDMRQQAIERGDQAYGAVVVRDGIIVGQSPSQVVVHRDPTAHAEMEAIRDAARRLGSRDLHGCILYSSSSPCPMCEAAAYWADIEELVYGVEAQEGGSPQLCR